MGDAAAMRLVAYSTRFGGWTDALGPGGGKDVNEGDRIGGRLSFTFQPNRDVTITPRLVYQKVTADGFNRQEVYNLYANPFTTTVPPVTFGEHQQYLLQREKFEDKTTIADLTVKVGFGGFDLTSVTTLYRSRHPGEPRCQRVDGFGVGRSRLSDRRRAAALAPQRHHRLQGLHAGIALELQGQGPAAMAGRRLLRRHRPQVCPAPADSGLRRLHRRDARCRNVGGGGQRLRPGLALQRRPSLQPEADRAVRRSELRLDQPADGNGGRCATTTTRKSAPSSPAACSPTATTSSTRRNRTATARACCWRTRCRRA